MSLPQHLNILVIGSGGREHAICYTLSQSARVKNIYCAPGNGGTANAPKTQNLAIGVNDFEAQLKAVEQHNIDLIWVGPEAPLAEGIVDFFEEKGIPIIGPNKIAAQLESSKAFAKQFMRRYGLPTPQFEVCHSYAEAYAVCEQHEWARVIKADGLALGKGVFVCDTLSDCENALKAIFEDQQFGAAGSIAVIEEKLTGREASLLMFCDGESLLPLPFSQDHKRRYEGDKGPNTGGMGAFAPVDWIKSKEELIQKQIIGPLAKALQHVDFNYKGVLFAGLMFDADGQPKLLEFNCRFGDPETQCLLPLLKTDMVDIAERILDRSLEAMTLEISPEYAVCVVISADAYPEQSSKDEKIEVTIWPDNALLFHAGTKAGEKAGEILTNGGRVLSVVGKGETLNQARLKAYQAVQAIQFNGMGLRQDIAQAAVVDTYHEPTVVPAGELVGVS